MENIHEPRCLLTIAGTDPCGGAGIQVDLQVFRDFGFHGLSVITAVVWQNTLGVLGHQPMPREVVEDQLAALLQDIPVAGVKIGMLPSAEIVTCVADTLAGLGDVGGVPIVYDPVMASGDGHQALMLRGTIETVKDVLLDKVDVLTPNIPEAEALLGRQIRRATEMPEAAEALRQAGCKAVLLKGGHLDAVRQPADRDRAVPDAWADANSRLMLEALPAIEDDVHGTGCQLSSAILASLAAGHTPLDAARRARRYLNKLLREQRVRIGKGRPVIVRVPKLEQVIDRDE